MTHQGKSSQSPLICVEVITADYSDYGLFTVTTMLSIKWLSVGLQWGFFFQQLLQNTGCMVLHLNATLQVMRGCHAGALCQSVQHAYTLQVFNSHLLNLNHRAESIRRFHVTGTIGAFVTNEKLLNNISCKWGLFVILLYSENTLNKHFGHYHLNTC